MNPPEASGTLDAATADALGAPENGPRVARRKPAAAGGPASYEAAFPELHAVAYRAAHRIARDGHRSEEIAQEAMVRAYMKWNKLHGETYRAAFVARVATNLAIGSYRREVTSRRFAPTLEASIPTNSLDDVEGRVRLQEALRSLPKRQREVVMLRVLADQSEVDTAAVLGCTVHAVRHHLAAAIQALRVREISGLIAPPEPATDGAGSAAAAVQAGADRRAKQRKIRGAVAGAIAFVVAALGSGLFGFGPVSLRSDDAKDRRNQTTTTTSTLAPDVPTTVIIGPNGTPVVVPVAPDRQPSRGTSSSPNAVGAPTAPSASTPPPPAEEGAGSSPDAFPDASTTGVLSGTTLTPVGGLTITTPGTVIEGRQINGCVSIEASNVTIRNSKIQGGCYYILMVSGSVTGVRLDRVEVDGQRAPTDATCVQGSNFTMVRSYVHACRLGVVPEKNVTIQDSYIAQVRSSAVRCFSCANIVVTRSNVESAGATAGAVDLGDDNGPIGAFTLTFSRLNGGNSTLRGGWNQGAGREPSSLIVTDNVFGSRHADSEYLFVGPRTMWARNTLEGSGRPLDL